MAAVFTAKVIKWLPVSPKSMCTFIYLLKADEEFQEKFETLKIWLWDKC